MDEKLTSQESLIGATALLNSTLLGIMKNDPSTGEAFDRVPKVLIACMPKSGSTWFTFLMERGLDLPSVRGYCQPDRNEQEIDPLALFQSLGKEVIFAQQHVRASATMLRLCKAFSIKVIFLTRYIDDAIVSFRDHLEKESTVAPMFYMEPEWFRGMSKTRQMDFLIEHCIPWYLNFSVGWMRAYESSPETILHVRYEQLISTPLTVIEEVSAFLGQPCRIEAEWLQQRSDVRFNQGRMGRGQEELSTSQHRRIRELAAFYEHVDLSSIGVSR